jgi:phage gpG-like protein
MSSGVFDIATVQDALLSRADAFRNALEARIQAKLNGGVLRSRSGALAASIQSAVEDDGSAVSILASSSGLAYAAIQEFGGKTAAHDIIAVKAKALAFNAGAGQAFARSVHHPGSNIPARSYIGGSLSEMGEDIVSGLKQAVLKALAQD